MNEIDFIQPKKTVGKLISIDVLDKIRDEIDAESARSFKYPNWERAKALEWALEIIDKYKEESEKRNV